ncbi:aminopeptidase P family protein [Parvularcula sp. ZS-1/3]|uniref:Aminopeptidase P family protein n=1 Tax=Parvularcula mediterranea TaxID=2732508 RepID=A0A7Y3W4B1_9PROT|nr:aminopeptidase P family protein [Parvularcula mediterranea]NNU15293.1 aminopeptidase P family protein [Parvularcula mediterranea]
MFQTFEPVSDRTFASRHLPLLREKLEARDLDGLIVPHEDEYLNEYLPDHTERLMWLTGFSGSAGSAIVLTKKAAAFSDGRYAIQLPQQVDADHFELLMTHDVTPEEWLRENAEPGSTIGYDPLLFSLSALEGFEKVAKKKGFTLKAVSPNPIDEAWHGRPDAPTAEVYAHPLKFAGEDHAAKLKRIGEDVREAGADAALLTSPSSIAWLFNVRGGDVHAAPLPLGRGIIHADGTGELFLDPRKVTAELRAHLGEHVMLFDETAVDERLTALGKEGKSVLIDRGLTPVHFISVVTEAGGHVVKGEDPVSLPRAIKNETEIEGSRRAHIRDGAAVTRFLHWLHDEADSGDISEINTAEKLENFRRETGVLKDISFDTITGSGPHGAMAHYRVSTETDRKLQPGELYLVDSGGQYEDGTTDITRVVAVGAPTREMRERYTLVLKGHIGLALARFPKGTSGHALDCLARLPLWKAGFDYDHGTGHGVGSFLSVHEGPQKISKHAIAQPLVPGMICSNEPGYYKAENYGIRIENLIVVTEATPIDGGERPMIAFENLTLAPLERELINPDMLTEEEIRWVDDYHAEVKAKISSQLPKEDAEWLAERCQPLR